jgi:hypothetical protein
VIEAGGIGKGGGTTAAEEMDSADMQWRMDKTARAMKVMEEQTLHGWKIEKRDVCKYFC